MSSRNGALLRCALWIGLLLQGCSHPCQSTSECGNTESCVAAQCQAVTCDTPVLALDPASGQCVSLSGCFMTAAQTQWKTCAADPCQGLTEASCLSDQRCQPVYQNPEVSGSDQSGQTTDHQTGAFCAFGGGGVTTPTPGPGMAGSPLPGVNNGTAPKHPSTANPCIPGSARAYAACRYAPQVAPQLNCESLTKDQCQTRRDCSTTQPSSGGNPDVPILVGVPTPVPGGAPSAGGSGSALSTGPVSDIVLGQCFTVVSRTTDCASADRVSCLTNPACQPIGGNCFCPPGATCACSGGQGFLGCEDNDRLRRCSSGSDCRSGERCDIDEACIAPRTYTGGNGQAAAGPGAPGCLGACVPAGCAGYGEVMCNGHSECNGGDYGTECHPVPYCGNGMNPGGPILPGSEGDQVPVSMPGGCGCGDVFKGCAPQTTIGPVRPERSLLVRDPQIVSDAAFRLDTVLHALAPAGQDAAFVSGWLQQVGSAGSLPSGAQAGAREGFAQFLQTQLPVALQTPAGLAALFHTTSLVNRIDLAQAGDCGEARITYAMNSGYVNGGQRMTIIVELKVPDDGQACKLAGQAWAELSLVDDIAIRLQKLQALYAALLSPAHLGQVRTNEFINPKGDEPWELREWHLNPAGMLALAPVAQTVDPKQAAQPEFQSWAQQNLAALQAGTAVIPTAYLAAASTENGQRVLLPDSDLTKAVNALACAGCHLTETTSPFVHVGERLGQMSGMDYAPYGRAVIDDFLTQQLTKRAQNLNTIVISTPKVNAAAPWRGQVAPGSH